MRVLAGKLHPQYCRTLAPHYKANRIERDATRKMHTPATVFRGSRLCRAQIRVTQIAVHAQGFIVAAGIWCLCSAASGEAISQRQPLAMRPELTRVNFRRNEVGTGHARSCQEFYSDHNPRECRVAASNFETLKPQSPACGNVFFMAVERSEQLKSILAQEPNNTFARYALGMEYASAGQTDSALEEFRTLLEVDANYANAFFMGAQALQRADRIEEAIAWLRDGIACAHRVGNRHAETEMQELLEELEA
jgi:hypothetical protein